MSPQTTHPLVDAYLRDLELLLHGVEPGERAEVLAGVREHLDGRLAPDADDTSVRAALSELGPPQAIADEAYAGQSPPAGSADAGSDFDRPTRRWVAATAGGLLALCLVVLLASAVFGGVGMVMMAFFVPTGPLWLMATAMVATSRRLWTAGEKLLLIVLVPVAYATVALSGIALLNNGLPSHLIPWLGTAVSIMGGSALLIRTAGRGLSRAA